MKLFSHLTDWNFERVSTIATNQRYTFVMRKDVYSLNSTAFIIISGNMDSL